MLEFHLFAYDTEFDYLHGTVPLEFRFDYGDQVRRAQKILAGRSEQEFWNALESLDWMLKQGSAYLFPKAIKESDEFPDGITINRVKALKALVPEYDIAGQKDLPNATWAEYFAVLTLAYFAEIRCELNVKPPVPSDSPIGEAINKNMERLGGNVLRQWALEAMEAICYAEELQRFAALEAQLQHASDASTVMRERGRKGGQARVARFGELRSKILAAYDENDGHWKSNRQAAMTIYDELKAEIDAVLTTDDPVKQLEKWIGAHVKKLSTS